MFTKCLVPLGNTPITSEELNMPECRCELCRVLSHEEVGNRRRPFGYEEDAVLNYRGAAGSDLEPWSEATELRAGGHGGLQPLSGLKNLRMAAEGQLRYHESQDSWRTAMLHDIHQLFESFGAGLVADAIFELPSR